MHEESLQYVGETATLFCLRDFLATPCYSDEIIEEQRRRAAGKALRRRRQNNNHNNKWGLVNSSSSSSEREKMNGGAEGGGGEMDISTSTQPFKRRRWQAKHLELLGKLGPITPLDLTRLFCR